MTICRTVSAASTRTARRILTLRVEFQNCRDSCRKRTKKWFDAGMGSGGGGGGCRPDWSGFMTVAA